MVSMFHLLKEQRLLAVVVVVVGTRMLEDVLELDELDSKLELDELEEVVVVVQRRSVYAGCLERMKHLAVVVVGIGVLDTLDDILELEGLDDGLELDELEDVDVVVV